MKRADRLQNEIEKALEELLGGKSKKTAEDKEELRRNVLLAIKWQSVKSKMSEDKWGSGFGNGKDPDEGDEDERLDD